MYYQIYRIFKDVFKTIFGKKAFRKLIITLVISIFIWSILHNYGYCAEVEDYHEYTILNKTTISLFTNGTNINYVSPFSNTTYNLTTQTSFDVYYFTSGMVVSLNGPLDNYVAGVYSDGDFLDLKNHYIQKDWLFTNTGGTAPSYDASQLGGSQNYEYIDSTYHGQGFAAPSYTDVTIGTTGYYLFKSSNAPLVVKYLNYNETQYSQNQAIINTLNEYLYGKDNQNNFHNINGMVLSKTAISTNGTFIAFDGYSLYYVPIHKGYTYKINASALSNVYYRVATSDNMPGWNVAHNGLLKEVQGTSFEYEYVADIDGYLCCSIYNIVNNRSIEFISNVNESLVNGGINGSINNVDNSTQQQTNVIINQTNELNNSITSTDYNQNDINVDTGASDLVSYDTYQGLFTTIFTNFNNAYNGGVATLVIPLPHNSGSLTITSDLVSKHLGALTSLVQAFWLYVFGLYAFKFVNNLILSIKDGSILNGFKNSNEVITSSMV